MVGFIIIGNQNAITYKEIFPYIKNNELWMGLSMNGSNRWFQAPDDYEVKANAAGYKVIDGKKYYFVNGVAWFTNIPHNHRNEPLDLYKKYSADKYPKYENYDAIEVSDVKNIPCDYDGVMGVPITFLYKYCPTQFEIIGMAEDNGKGYSYGANWDGLNPHCVANGKNMYKRIFIRRKKNEEIVEYGKNFLIIGNKNAMLWKTIFPKYYYKQLYFGHNYISKFRLPDNTFNWFQGSGRWFTTFPVIKENPPIALKPYAEDKYPKYDTYDAVNTDSIKDIPDYDGEIGVPIGILDYLCKDQFTITGMLCRGSGDIDKAKPIINGKHLYSRVLIKKK